MEVFQIDQIQKDDLAIQIGLKWYEADTARNEWKQQKQELRNYVVATDTKKTANSKLPWRHTTTIPKLTQIRDNLHAQYMSALFPNDEWLRWEAYSKDGLNKDKKQAIQFYMRNKLRRTDFQKLVSELLYDYIDFGNVYVAADYIRHVRPADKTVPGSLPQIMFQGPKARRISPYDIVFDPTNTDFYAGWVITREIKTLGDMKKEVSRKTGTERRTAEKAFKRVLENRRAISGSWNTSDFDSKIGISVDGFGTYSQYLQSDYCEILTFRGDWFNKETGELHEDRVITVLDRAILISDVQNETWNGNKGVVHGTWRGRSDTLIGMGPLDNIVGMQYKIDHLENIKADMFDLIAMPPIKLRGAVENFSWEPLAEIHLGEDADVEMLSIDAKALQAETQISILEQKMEEFAGAPRQAVGQRTPGEKTAFEIQVLEQNSSKMFQEKIQRFEVNVLEPLLNMMLETARRNIEAVDLISTMDDDFGTQNFITITREDLSIEGKIVPIGARHFLQRNLAIQNYIGLRNAIAADPTVMAHISGKAEARMFEDLLGLEKYDLVRENVRVEEAMETAKLQQEGMAMLQEQAATPATDMEREVRYG
jgi:hypothetical protein